MFDFSKQRQYWPQDQSDRVAIEFAGHIARSQVPNQEQCLAKVENYPHCDGDWSKLKHKVNNLIIASNRMKGKKR